ncbi:MAG: hypothetical protein ACO23R_02670 [bacterium]
MTRSIDLATIEALESDSFNLATLVQFEFDTVIRFTDWARPVAALSNTFSSSSHIIDYSSFNESSDLRVGTATITLSGSEQTYISLFLNNDYIDVRARIWRAVLDSSDAVIGSPILVFDGRISGYQITDTETESQVQIDIASHWKNFELSNGRKTNNNMQQLYFPGDLGFEYAAVTQKDIKWGVTS